MDITCNSGQTQAGPRKMILKREIEKEEGGLENRRPLWNHHYHHYYHFAAINFPLQAIYTTKTNVLCQLRNYLSEFKTPLISFWKHYWYGLKFVPTSNPETTLSYKMHLVTTFIFSQKFLASKFLLNCLLKFIQHLHRQLWRYFSRQLCFCWWFVEINLGNKK